METKAIPELQAEVDQVRAGLGRISGELSALTLAAQAVVRKRAAPGEDGAAVALVRPADIADAQAAVDVLL